MNIYEAITAAMEDVVPIAKGRRNEKQGFSFRGIDEIMNELQPVLKKHGLFVVPRVRAVERQEIPSKSGGTLLYSIITMEYTMYSADGTSVTGATIGEGMDSGDKASNKAMAVALKYFLLQTFCIPTEDTKDPDAESPEVGTRPPALDPVKLETLAGIMKKNRPDGTPYFTQAQRDGYKKQIKTLGLDEALKSAELALEAMDASQ